MRASLVVVVIGIASAVAAGQELDALTVVKQARSRRVSSTSADALSNADNRWVKPGETFTMAELAGPGVIRHLWITFAEARPSWLAKDGAADPGEIVLRMYWDGASEPAVEAPFGDFFAVGFGKRAPVRSTPVQVEGGDAYNCYWPMPFFKSARITITNESQKPLAALYYQVDYTEEPLPSDRAYFCAQYRQEYPTALGKDYLILDAEGAGQYVGTVMSVRTRSPEWFGEGDDKIYVDGEPQPSLFGTGTEDYFCNAWGLETSSFPYFGVTVLEGDWGHVGQRTTAYRWHIADPICFRQSLRVTIEHFGWMSADETKSGKVEGFDEREDDFATVAFWYQRGQPKRFTAMPPLAARKLPSIDRIIDGRQLLAHATASGGALSLQQGYDWTGDGQLFFAAESAAASCELWFEVATEELRRLVLPITRSYDFGIYQVSLDGARVGEAIDCYGPEVTVKELSLGDLRLKPGPHTIKLECVGKNLSSSGYRIGVDSVRLRERFPPKREPPRKQAG
ncbi:MAG: glycoside hydrolase family 172 protein [Planctomycetota bacterium]